MKLTLRSCPLLLALLLAGCRGEPAVKLVPVSGRITVGQKPLVRVAIQLVPDGSKGTHAPAGAGQTDEDGSFRITTPPHGDGAVPGHYKVLLVSYPANSVPPSYANAQKTPLWVEIPPEGLEDWDLDLSKQ
jgi:hypothetical protein